MGLDTHTILIMEWACHRVSQVFYTRPVVSEAETVSIRNGIILQLNVEPHRPASDGVDLKKVAIACAVIFVPDRSAKSQSAGNIRAKKTEF